jgi:hypothetical protein
MARSKQNKAPKKDGKHRAETKEERKARLEAEAKAREVRSHRGSSTVTPVTGGHLLFGHKSSYSTFRTVPLALHDLAYQLLVSLSFSFENSNASKYFHMLEDSL